MAYTIESSYKPFSFQELVTPYMLYKDAYDKQEANLEALYDKASAFSDLDDLPEDSQARKIYDNYMSTLNAANKDFATNGLTMNNRGLYNNIRKRYQGEIGRLAQAKTKVEDINKQRIALRMQGKGMIYSKDNIDIDDMLGKDKPNMFGISTDYLYSLGSKAGATSSSRVWSNPEIKKTANKFYMLASQSNGYTPEILAQMREDFMSIPEFRKQVENAMKANGVTENLKGDKYTQAALNYVNGFVDSCTYKKNDNFMQNPEPEYNEKVREFNETKRMQEEQFTAQMQAKGLVKQDDGTYSYDMTKDPEYQKAVQVAKIKAEGKGKTGSKKGYKLANPIEITWDEQYNNTTRELPYVSEYEDGNTVRTRKYNGSHRSFDDLKTDWTKEDKLEDMLSGIPQVVKDNPYEYEFYYSQDPKKLTVVPIEVGTTVTNSTEGTEDSSFTSLH